MNSIEYILADLFFIAVNNNLPEKVDMNYNRYFDHIDKMEEGTINRELLERINRVYVNYKKSNE